jgi:hypothetical protein
VRRWEQGVAKEVADCPTQSAERRECPLLSIGLAGRGDWHSFEPLGAVRPFIEALAEPHVLVAVEIVALCA